MRPIVIGGCPGAGKSSISTKLSENIENCVLIETDNFYDYLTNPFDPSKPESKAQNETVISAYTEAANVYRKVGYSIILEGVIGPWVFPIMIPLLGDFDYFLLHTSLESACERVSAREEKTVSLGKVERMHPKFENILSNYSAHVIDTGNTTLVGSVSIILSRLESGSCEIQGT